MIVCPVCYNTFKRKTCAFQLHVNQRCTKHREFYRIESEKILREFYSDKSMLSLCSDLFPSIDSVSNLFRKMFGVEACKQRRTRITRIATNAADVRARSALENSKTCSKRTKEQKLRVHIACSVAAKRAKRVIDHEKYSESAQKRNRYLISNGLHNWPNERPCNNPTERIFDLLLVPIFRVDVNHNFKVENQDGREFQCDFLSLVLHRWQYRSKWRRWGNWS
jgi:hypothetical protein